MAAGLTPLQSQRNRENTRNEVNPPSRFARFGAFDFDLQKLELFQKGSRVRLQGKVCQALLTLLEKPGQIVTREELRLRLWPAEGRINYDANVNTTVNKLRVVLGDSTEQPIYVETIPRMGYSFIAGVEYSDQLPARGTAEVYRAEASAAKNQFAGEPLGWKAYLTRVARPSTWFTAGIIALVIAGILLGAAIVIFTVRAV